jgi:hypothetical protein
LNVPTLALKTAQNVEEEQAVNPLPSLRSVNLVINNPTHH